MNGFVHFLIILTILSRKREVNSFNLEKKFNHVEEKLEKSSKEKRRDEKVKNEREDNT